MFCVPRMAKQQAPICSLSKCMKICQEKRKKAGIIGSLPLPFVRELFQQQKNEETRHYMVATPSIREGAVSAAKHEETRQT